MYKKFSKEVVIVFLGNFGGILISLIGMRYLTALLDVSTFGELSLLTTLYTIGNSVFFGPLNNGVGRFFIIAIEAKSFTSFEYGCFRLLKSVALLLVALGIISSLYFFITSNTFWAIGIVLSSIYAVLLGYSNFFNTVQLILRQRTINAFLSIIGKGFSFALPCAMVYCWKSSSLVVIGAYILSTLILLVLQTYFYKKTKLENFKLLNNENEIDYRREMMQFSLPFVSWGIFQSVQFAVERWSLSIFCSIEDVGFYTVLSQIGFQTPSIFYGIISSLLTPILFEKSGSSSTELIIQSVRFNNKVCVVLGVISLLTVPIVHIWGADLLVILVDAKFSKNSELLSLFVLSSIFFNIGQLVSTNFTINLKPSRLIFPKVVNMSLTICLSIVLSKSMGIKGVAYALLVTSFLYLLWMVLLTTSYVKTLKS